jgi:hypothetical protein
VFSDERYHVVDGNDRIVEGLTQDLPRPVEHGMQLLAVSKTSAGTIRLTFRAPSGASVERTHDAAVLAVPFSTLRDVHLDVTLGLSPEKRAAIDLLGYGTNAKLMVGYQARPWRAHGGNGGAYADLPNLQTTWETNPARATAGRAILTDYSGGDRGASIDPNDVQTAAGLFVAELDRVFPGAQASVRREDGHIVAHLEHWPSHPLTRGSYTCYRPGQFTTIAGSKASRRAICSLPASIRTPSTSGRALWKARCSRVSMRRPESSATAACSPGANYRRDISPVPLCEALNRFAQSTAAWLGDEWPPPPCREIRPAHCHRQSSGRRRQDHCASRRR